MSKDSNNNKTALSKLEKLKKQKEKLTARIQQVEQRTRSQERKRDARRKILVGAYYLDKAKAENKMELLRQALSQYLKRESDRQLFDLPPLKEGES